VARLAKVTRLSSFHAEAVRVVVIRGGRHAGRRSPVPHLGTFAAMLARRLTRLKEFCLWSANWDPSLMQADVLLHLSAFHSVTLLSLINVVFPSTQIFGRLVCSLPNLDMLYCIDIKFTQPTFDAAFFLKCPPHKQLTRLTLDESPMADVINFLVVANMAANFKTIQLGYFNAIYLHEVKAFGIQRLLRAASESVQKLDLTLVGPTPQRKVTAETPNAHTPLDLSPSMC